MRQGNEIEQKSTNIRKGTIDDINIEYMVTAKFNGIHVCGAEGHFYSPDNAYQKFLGAHQNLYDIETGNTYVVFVSNDRFSFDTYSKIDELFKNSNL